MNYSMPQHISTPVGNNVFSFEKRKQLGSKATITIPALQNITTLDQITLGNAIVFEEVDHQGKLTSCNGLAYIYVYKHPITKQPVYIFDNHNHALYFWMVYKNNQPQSPTTLIHIDQHSDLNTTAPTVNHQQISDQAYLWEYTNKQCNIGNFIHPFLSCYPDTNFTRIKSELQLLDIAIGQIDNPLIVDIDLDFWAPEMSVSQYDQSVTVTRQLLRHADLITIASSPFFIDQSYALTVLDNILGE